VELQSLEPQGKPLSKGETRVTEPKPAVSLEEMPQSQNNQQAEPLKELEQVQ